MLGSAYPFIEELPPEDGLQLLSAAQPLLSGSDIVFGNLEGTLIDDVSLVRPCPPTSTTCFRFGMPVRYATHLKKAGFTALSLGNNHIHDFDEIGRQLTLRAADEYGFTSFGTVERPSSTQVLDDGTRIGWVGYAPHTGANPPSLSAIRAQVAALKANHDLVFMSMHVGGEGSKAQHITRATEMFLGQNRGDPYAFAHAAIDAGADLVIGHGPHVLRGVELYKGRLIAYSLGNFSTYGRFNLKGPNGLTGILKVTLAKDGEFLHGQFLGMRQERNSADWQRGVTPVPDTTGEAVDLLRALSSEDFPESRLLIDKEGRLIRLDAPPEPATAPPLPPQSRRPATIPTQMPPPQASNWVRVRDGVQSIYTRSRDAFRKLADR